MYLFPFSLVQAIDVAMARLKFSFSVFLFLSYFWCGNVEAWFEYCGKSGGIYTVAFADCPFGVLFRNQQDVGNCYYPQGADSLSNACTGEGEIDDTMKLQFIDAGESDADGPESSTYKEDTCKDANEEDPSSDKCTGDYVKIDKSNTIYENGENDDDGYMQEANNTGVERTQVDVRNQTLRLFLYMSDLLIDENENLPVLRLVNLIKKSFEVLRKHCNIRYVSETFSKEIEKAFLFLVRESDLIHVRDIDVHEFSKINAVLDKCLRGMPPFPFYLIGSVCKQSTKIQSIVKTWPHPSKTLGQNKSHSLQPPNEFSFKWGKYDLPIDATWSVMDFTHGMCYGTFKDDMNSHHLYEQALQRLFTTELMFRWSKPIRLIQEYFWDHIFRSYTDTSMKNLDACIQAAYLGSPYLHRLSRPMVKQSINKPNNPDGKGRRKREADLNSNAWCLTTPEEKEAALKQVKATC